MDKYDWDNKPMEYAGEGVSTARAFIDYCYKRKKVSNIYYRTWTEKAQFLKNKYPDLYAVWRVKMRIVGSER